MDVQKMCRICLKSDLLVSIYSPTFLMRPAEMIEKLHIFKLHIADNLPKMLCQSCLFRLLDAYNLQQLAETSERHLREYLGTCVDADGILLVRNNNADVRDMHMLHAAGNTNADAFAQICDIAVDAATDDVLNDVEIDVSSLTRSEPDDTLSEVFVSEATNFEQFETNILENIAAAKTNFIEDTTEKIDLQSNAKTVSKRFKKPLKKPDECAECGKVFLYSGYLAAHKRIHTGEKPYKCKLCARTFTQSSNWLLHQRRHTGERRFQCELCANFFTTSSNLKAHRLTHTEQRNFKCNNCARSFKTLRELHRHEPVHKIKKDIICQLCQKAFNKHAYLSAHLAAVHHGIKRHKCSQCNKEFVNKSNYICHMRVHTGERPFQCKLCPWKFNQSSALLRHMKRHLQSATTAASKITTNPDNLTQNQTADNQLLQNYGGILDFSTNNSNNNNNKHAINNINEHKQLFV